MTLRFVSKKSWGTDPQQKDRQSVDCLCQLAHGLPNNEAPNLRLLLQRLAKSEATHSSLSCTAVCMPLTAFGTELNSVLRSLVSQASQSERLGVVQVLEDDGRFEGADHGVRVLQAC